MTTYTEAVDEMLTRVDDAISTYGPANFNYTPELEIEGVRETDTKAQLKKVWCRTVVRNTEDRQNTLGTDDSTANAVEFISRGVLITQVFIPRSNDRLLPKARVFAQAVRDKFRRANDCVQYQRATMRELAPEKRWYRINITVDYHFTQTVSN